MMVLFAWYLIRHNRCHSFSGEPPSASGVSGSWTDVSWRAIQKGTLRFTLKKLVEVTVLCKSSNVETAINLIWQSYWLWNMGGLGESSSLQILVLGYAGHWRNSHCKAEGNKYGFTQTWTKIWTCFTLKMHLFDPGNQCLKPSRFVSFWFGYLLIFPADPNLGRHKVVTWQWMLLRARHRDLTKHWDSFA